MLHFFPLKIRALSLIFAMAFAGTISACHSNNVARTQASVARFAETAFGPNGLVDAELTQPFDDTPITPMETVGAPAESN